jgi:hypothetical protein
MSDELLGNGKRRYFPITAEKRRYRKVTDRSAVGCPIGRSRFSAIGSVTQGDRNDRTVNSSGVCGRHLSDGGAFAIQTLVAKTRSSAVSQPSLGCHPTPHTQFHVH